MSDVRLFQTNDGGEIEITNGVFSLDDGILSAVYMSLFGGTERDGGGTDTESVQWWGNRDEPDPVKRYRSETGALLRSIPLVPANLRRVEDAVARDLAWMLDTKLATFIGAAVTIPALNTMDIRGVIEIDGRKIPFSFTARSPQT